MSDDPFQRFIDNVVGSGKEPEGDITSEPAYPSEASFSVSGALQKDLRQALELLINVPEYSASASELLRLVHEIGAEGATLPQLFELRNIVVSELSVNALARIAIGLPHSVHSSLLGTTLHDAIARDTQRLNDFLEVRSIEDPRTLISHPLFRRSFPGFGLVQSVSIPESQLTTREFLPEIPYSVQSPIIVSSRNDDALEQYRLFGGGFLATSTLLLSEQCTNVSGVWYGEVKGQEVVVKTSDIESITFSFPESLTISDQPVLIQRENNTLTFYELSTGTQCGSLEPVPSQFQYSQTKARQIVEVVGGTYPIGIDQSDTIAADLAIAQQVVWFLENNIPEITMKLSEDEIAVVFTRGCNDGVTGKSVYNHRDSKIEIVLSLLPDSEPINIAAALAYQVGRYSVPSQSDPQLGEESLPGFYLRNAAAITEQHLAGVTQVMRFACHGVVFGFLSTDEATKMVEPYFQLEGLPESPALERVRALGQMLLELSKEKYSSEFPDNTTKVGLEVTSQITNSGATQQPDAIISQLNNEVELGLELALVSEQPQGEESTALVPANSSSEHSLNQIDLAEQDSRANTIAALLRERETLIGLVQFSQSESNEQTVDVEALVLQEVANTINRKVTEDFGTAKYNSDLNQDNEDEKYLESGGRSYFFEEDSHVSSTDEMLLDSNTAHLLARYVIKGDTGSFQKFYQKILQIVAQSGDGVISEGDAEEYWITAEEIKINLVREHHQELQISTSRQALVRTWLSELVHSDSVGFNILTQLVAAELERAYHTDKQVHARVIRLVTQFMNDNGIGPEQLAESLLTIAQDYDTADDAAFPPALFQFFGVRTLNLPGSNETTLNGEVDASRFMAAVNKIHGVLKTVSPPESMDSRVHLQVESDVRMLVQGAVSVSYDPIRFIKGILQELTEPVFQRLGSNSLRDQELPRDVLIAGLAEMTIKFGIPTMITQLVRSFDVDDGFSERRDSARMYEAKAVQRLFEIHTELEQLGIDPDLEDLRAARAELGWAPDPLKSLN